VVVYPVILTYPTAPPLALKEETPILLMMGDERWPTPGTYWFKDK
jgi:hypothetical protein